MKRDCHNPKMPSSPPAAIFFPRIIDSKQTTDHNNNDSVLHFSLFLTSFGRKSGTTSVQEQSGADFQLGLPKSSPPKLVSPAQGGARAKTKRICQAQTQGDFSANGGESVSQVKEFSLSFLESWQAVQESTNAFCIFFILSFAFWRQASVARSLSFCSSAALLARTRYRACRRF